MTTAGYILFAIGAFVTLTNAYLFFLRYPIHLARGKSREDYRWVSGIPLFGSLLLWISIPLLASTELRWLAGILSVFDTGGIHWAFATMYWTEQGDFVPARRLLWPALACVAIVAATAMLLHVQGRLWWCACGEWFPFSGEARGPHNSQHLFDPYALTHVLHGVLFYGLFAIGLPRLALRWRWVLAIGIEAAWEIFENTAFVIERYRNTTAALGYEGDTIANSLGDIVACVVGLWLAARLGFWKSLVFFLAVELLLLVWIRDSLLLNVVMLLYPFEAIRTWQNGS